MRFRVVCKPVYPPRPLRPTSQTLSHLTSALLLLFTTLQYHTPLAVGTLLGLTTMMSQFMFVLFAVFLALAEYADEPGLATGDRTMAVFSFFLFLLYVSSAGVGRSGVFAAVGVAGNRVGVS